MGRRSKGIRAVNLAQPFLCSAVVLLSILGVAKVMAAGLSTSVVSTISLPPPQAEVKAVHTLAQLADSRLDCSQKACLALTFDDGPDPVLTPQVLDVLARHKARATFFVVGVRAAGNGAILRRMHQEGHEIGNHSWNHADLTTLTPDQIKQQVYDTQAAVTRSGVPAPRLLRPPYGAVNDVVRSNVPLTLVGWNIDPEDWRAKKPIEKIVEHVSQYAKPGGVVILHDTQPRLLQALDPLLTTMEANYQFVTVSELFYLAPGQSGMFYGR